MDSWIPDDDKQQMIDVKVEDAAPPRPAFSSNCIKCDTYTAEDPELRGWWPAINGKFCADMSELTVYPNEVLTWYCKQCYVQENSNILVRMIRKIFP